MHSGDDGEAAGGQEHDARARSVDRERILAAITREAAERGYAETSVTSIAQRAGVPRPTFYELFPDKEGCLLAAFDEIAASTLGSVAGALARCDPGDAHRCIVRSFVGLIQESREAFLLVTHEATCAGPRPLQLREAFVEDLCRMLESCWTRASAAERIPDLPALLVIGGVIRSLAMALRHGSFDAGREQAELEVWIDAYRVESRTRRWRELRPDQGLDPGGAAMGNRIRPPRPLPRRGDVASAAFNAIEREHILHAAATLVSERGYDRTAVADIAALAHVSRESFYRQFDGKGAVVDAAATLLFEQAMAAMGGAYFASSTPWPERIWQTSRALTTVLASSQSFTHTGFIESFSPGPASARRADELFLGFTIFLTEGAELARETLVPSVAGRAITGATIELGASRAARGASADLPGLVPLGVLLTISPYVGIEEANEYIESRRRGQA